MEERHIDCRECDSMSEEAKVYAAKTCRLCGTCDECLNEAGYCVPCSEKLGYSKEEAIVI